MELEIRGLNISFGGNDGDPSFTLNIPSLRTEVGKVTYLMGHNGSGKSVLLKLLSQEYDPSNGKLETNYDGEPENISHFRVGIVRQKAEDSLSLSLTVRENLLIRLSKTTIPQSMNPRRLLQKSIEQVLQEHRELLNKINQPCSKLSGGQRQTLAFLAVTFQQCNVLCLDEFLSSTDQDTTNILRRLAKEYAINSKACILIVSHDIELALEDADRICILRKGQLIKTMDRTSSDWQKEKLSQLLGL